MARPQQTADPIGLVEAAYDDAPREQWLRTLVERTSTLVPESRASGCYGLDLRNPNAPSFSSPLVVGLPVGFAAVWIERLAAMDLRLVARACARKVGSLSELGGGKASTVGPVGELAEQYGADAFYCIALDSEGRGLVLSTLLSRPQQLTRGIRSRWSLLGAHLAAADRLRRKPPDERQDDCILSPGGRVEHAEGAATGIRAREQLRAAVVARDKARTRAVRSSPDEALALWRGLVSGQWSLLDRFESDGRRYVVARRNEPVPTNPMALTLRERQILGHLLQGDALKVAAYALGIDVSTVSATAKTLLLKLGVRDVSELAQLVASMGVTAGSAV
jgi:DNA-binding CsgD family transcriptional regulator